MYYLIEKVHSAKIIVHLKKGEFLDKFEHFFGIISLWSDILFCKTGFAYQSVSYKMPSESLLSQLSFETNFEMDLLFRT